MTTYRVSYAIPETGQTAETETPTITAGLAFIGNAAKQAIGVDSVAVCGSVVVGYHNNAKCGGHDIGGRIRQTAPWWSAPNDMWVGFDAAGNVVPVNR